MATTAAYNKKIQISVDSGSTWLELPATTASLEIGGEILDDTTLAEDTGYRKRIYGLLDWSISFDANWRDADTGLVALKDAKLARTTPVLARYLPIGDADPAGLAAGFQGTVVIESLGLSGDVAGLETSSISLQGDGALAVATA